MHASAPRLLLRRVARGALGRRELLFRRAALRAAAGPGLHRRGGGCADVRLCRHVAVRLLAVVYID
eukprot:4143923-Alexandrium_andersonii.AAC.1